MQYFDYIAAREAVGAWGKPMVFSLTLLALTLIILSLLKREQARRILLAILALLLLGFGILVWFHLRIYQSIEIIDPSTGQVAGRLSVPLWIENEKLYFWALFLGFFTYLVNRRYPKLLFSRWLNILFAGLVILAVLTSDPFTFPLPGLHQELREYYGIMEQGDPWSQVQIFQSISSRMKYFYNSTYMWIHPPMLFISYGALAVAFLACLFMLGYRKESIYDSLAYNYAKFGYLLLTIGIFISYPWALSAWKDEPWWWSPKINMTLVMWVLYTGYLHSRLHLHRRGMWNTTAILGIFCFLALVFTYVTTYLIPGVHSYG